MIQYWKEGEGHMEKGGEERMSKKERERDTQIGNCVYVCMPVCLCARKASLV